MNIWIKKKLVTALACVSLLGAASAQLDGTCTATVNGQSVTVNPNGTFRLANIPATDEFVRVRVTCQQEGQTLYGLSPFFKVTQGNSFSIGDIGLSTTPLLETVSLSAEASEPFLELGNNTSIAVTATFSNGSDGDVSGPLLGSTYTSSNTTVATIDDNGQVTGTGLGTTFITVRNEGATAVERIDVVSQLVDSTVVGSVVLEDGSPAALAQVTIQPVGITLMADTQGSFTVPINAGPETFITAFASLDGSSGSSISAPVVASGLTDVGVITLGELPLETLIFTTSRSSNQPAILQGHLTNLGFPVEIASTLPVDLSVYGTIWHIGAFEAITVVEAQQLIDFVKLGRGLQLTAERPCCEVLNQSVQDLLNAIVTKGGISIGGMGDPPTPHTFNPNALGGITLAPNLLTTWQSGGPAGMTGIEGQNILATASNGITIAGIWGESDLVGGSGRIVLLADQNWYGNPGDFQIVENAQLYLRNSVGQ